MPQHARTAASRPLIMPLRPPTSSPRVAAPARRVVRWPRRLLAAVLVWLLCVAAYVVYVSHQRVEIPADAIVVLGAAAYDDDPSPVFERRIQQGLALYQRGLAPQLVFTGGFGGRRARFSESQVARAYALAHGVPSSAILIESRSRTTRGNLQGAACLLRMSHGRRILLVSDPLHMARALWLARDLGLQAYPAPTPASLISSTWAKTKFLAREVMELHGEAARRAWTVIAHRHAGRGNTSCAAP